MERIDLATFIKALKKENASVASFRIGNVLGGINLEKLTFHYDDTAVNLDRMAGTYGGYRYFFLCGACGRRCRVIYTARNLLACGECVGLYKQTRNRTKTDCTYYWRLAEKEIQKVKPDYKAVDYIEMVKDFPNRVKYMRAEKLAKHRKRFLRYWDKGTEKWLAGVGRL